MMEVTLSACQRQCAEDVCMYCGGRALGFERHPVGPNEAGNFVHAFTHIYGTPLHVAPHPGRRSVLCQASGIYSRAHYFDKMRETAASLHREIPEDEPQSGEFAEGRLQEKYFGNE